MLSLRISFLFLSAHLLYLIWSISTLFIDSAAVKFQLPFLSMLWVSDSYTQSPAHLNHSRVQQAFQG
jgi:hypothetical protein